MLRIFQTLNSMMQFSWSLLDSLYIIMDFFPTSFKYMHIDQMDWNVKRQNHEHFLGYVPNVSNDSDGEYASLHCMAARVKQ